MAKRFPLPRRFSAALTEDAYARLRSLNDDHGLSDNDLRTVLLESLDDYADKAKLKAAFDRFIDEYGALAAGETAAKDDTGRKD